MPGAVIPALAKYEEGTGLLMGKNPPEWVEEDLNSLVTNQVGEDVNIEYKACDSLKKEEPHRDEVSKDVSAFANAAGGVLVYGMLEDPKTHLPTGLDSGYTPSDISKEWLENVIHSRIKPKIESLHINQVQLTGPRAGKIAYVVSVLQSTTAHQASDKKYYKRYNFKREAMEDYEVRDAMNRVKHPLLEPEFSFDKMDNKIGQHLYSLKIKLVNTGPVRVRDIKLVIGLPRLICSETRGLLQRFLKKEGLPPHNEYFENSLEINKVVFPGDEWNVTENSGVCILYRMDTALYTQLGMFKPFLYWKTYADDMPPRFGEVSAKKLIQWQ